MAIGLMVKVNETSECPTENILPFFMLEHNNDVYTNWIFNIVTKPIRKMCKFLSGMKKCLKKPKPPTVRQASNMASKMTKTNYSSYFGNIVFMYLQFFK